MDGQRWQAAFKLFLLTYLLAWGWLLISAH